MLTLEVVFGAKPFRPVPRRPQHVSPPPRPHPYTYTFIPHTCQCRRHSCQTPTHLLNGLLPQSNLHYQTKKQSHPPPSSMASHQETKREEHHTEERTTMSPEEVGKYRAEAQQNSVEAIRAAEERYSKAKEASGAALHDTKEAVVHGLGATTAYLASKGAEAKDVAARGAHVAAEYTTEKAAVAKDVALEKGQQG